MEREQTMLPVDGTKNTFALRHFQRAEVRVALDRRKRELFIAGNNHGARNRRQVARLPALLVVLNQLIDFPANDLPLIGFLVRRDATLQQIPIHLRRRAAAPAALHGLRLLAVAQHFEPYQLFDITRGQGRLIELHPELLHSDRGNVDHKERKSYWRARRISTSFWRSDQRALEPRTCVQ